MGKIVKFTQIQKIIVDLKNQGKKIVLAGGCFDILHVGHISFLEKAKASGDILILLLESDHAIKLLKGDKRPINPQENRAKVLRAVEFVDFVVTLPKPFKTSDYQKLTFEIKPNVIAVTEGDPHLREKESQAKAVNGIVKVVLQEIPEHSTTKLLDYF
jgi:rfaE bifunctional protein nucleotidyltransferase chain/domain